MFNEKIILSQVSCVGTFAKNQMNMKVHEQDYSLFSLHINFCCFTFADFIFSKYIISILKRIYDHNLK